MVDYVRKVYFGAVWRAGLDSCRQWQHAALHCRLAHCLRCCYQPPRDQPSTREKQQYKLHCRCACMQGAQPGARSSTAGRRSQQPVELCCDAFLVGAHTWCLCDYTPANLPLPLNSAGQQLTGCVK